MTFASTSESPLSENGGVEERSQDWIRSLVVALGCVIGVRLFLTVYLAVFALLVPLPYLRDQYSYAGVEFLDRGWDRVLLSVWQREDALWYQRISTVGYSTTDMTQEFFPLFPMLVRLLTWVTGLHPIAAGITISEVSLLGAFLLLHRLLLPGFGAGVADRTLAYLSIFPSAFFFHAPFSESLTLLVVLLAFFMVSKQRWAEAALVAYLAGLSRPQGVLLGPALALQVLAAGRTVAQWRSFRCSRLTLQRAGVLMVSPVIGLLTFLATVDTAWRRPGVYSGIGPGHGIPAFPGTAMFAEVQEFLAGEVHPIELFNFVLAIAIVVLLAIICRRFDAGYFLYALLLFLAPLSRVVPHLPLMSFNRYALLLFPVFVALAVLGRNRAVHVAVVLVCLVGLVYLSGVFYVGGFVG